MLNDIKLHGYLGKDPKLTTEQGQNGPYQKAAFSLGVSRDYGDTSDWFFCVVYGKRAEVIEKYFRKGSEIFVSGRMESYNPKTDPDRTAWIVKVNNFDFAGKSSKSGSSGSSAQSAPAESVPDSFDQIEEDVPF